MKKTRTVQSFFRTFFMTSILMLSSFTEGGQSDLELRYRLAVKAIQHGNLAAIFSLLQDDPLSVYWSSTRSDATLLHIAVINERNEIARMLVEAGADVDAISSWIRPLHMAIKAENLELVQILIEAGADVNAIIGRIRLLHTAIRAENLELVQILIEAGADVDATTIGGIIPLEIAVRAENLEFAQILIEAGADVNAEVRGRRLLDLLYSQGLLALEEMIILLESRGATCSNVCESWVHH